MSDELTDDELRRWARGLVAEHDPAFQVHGYERCELCGYTRHPCDVFDLATTVLTLLDRLGA